ncbi:MAG: hypothetical protein HQM09_22870, partial [Candidatus Riflebacteria bacterium]|nr:hypothetical protein [Candidatus Riflebacteria bacterium]
RSIWSIESVRLQRLAEFLCGLIATSVVVEDGVILSEVAYPEKTLSKKRIVDRNESFIPKESFETLIEQAGDKMRISFVIRKHACSGNSMLIAS